MVRLYCLVLTASLLLTVGSRALAQESAASGGVEVDEFLFPVEGALAKNLGLLQARLSRSPGPAVQGLYGVQLLASGDYSGARRHCEEALKRGTLFEPVYCMAMLHFTEGSMVEAREFARQAVSLRPDSVAPYILLANVGKTLNDKEAIISAMEEGRKNVPERAPFWEWELAHMMEALGDLDAALQCSGTLAKLTPDDPRVFTQAGDWLTAKKRLQEAAQMYSFALSKASWYLPAALSLMETHKADNQWLMLRQIALRVLDNIQLSEIHATARTLLETANEALYVAGTQSTESRHSISLSDLHTFNDIDPVTAADILVAAAKDRMELGFSDRAVPLLDKARRMTSSNAEVLLLLAEGLARLGRLDRAAGTAREAIQIQTSVRGHALLADIHAQRSQFEACLEQSNMALEVQPDHVDAMLLKALCHRALRQEKEELEALLAAVKIDPENMRALQELADYYLSSPGGNTEAAGFLKQLFNLAPYDYRLCLKLADIETSLQRYQDALVSYSRCIHAIPPALKEFRTDAYGKLRQAEKGVDSVPAIVDALQRTCHAGHEQACTDVRQYLEKAEKRRKLKTAGYRSSRRGGFKGELERLGDNGEDFLLLGLEAPGFDELKKRDKFFLFYMSRAAIAGDDLLYLQNHRHALLIKQVMETLFAYRNHLPDAVGAAVHDYLKYLWVNHGNYDHRSGVKFVPRLLRPGALREALEAMMEKGIPFTFIPGSSVQEKFAYIRKPIFDKDFEPLLTVTEKGVDIIAQSSVNHYDPGITEAMIAALPDGTKHALNVRFALRGGEVLAQRYSSQELGARYIGNIIHFLKLALPYADEGYQKLSIEELIRFYETGDEKWFIEHSRNWLKAKGTTDYINGFVEQLKDPRGVIGNFEGMAAFVADAGQVDALAQAASYFEERMPWPDAFKRKTINKPVANVAMALMGTGDMGPVPWAGYNLPNYDDIRTNVGSKNVIFINIMTAHASKDRKAFVAEFYLPAYRKIVQTWGDDLRKWEVYLHEIIGHGSGCPAETLKEDPRKLIGRSFSALEEARADLVALYFLGDQKLGELGAWSKSRRDEFVLAGYVEYFQQFLTLYRKFHGDVIREAHWKGRQLILSFLTQGSEDGKQDYGISIEIRDGNYFVVVNDEIKVRKGLADLLEKIQTIKSNGDKEGADKLLDRFGTAFDKKIQENMIARAAKIRAARQSAFVFPHLKPITTRKGELTDVKAVHDEDLTSQHLRFSRLQRSTDLD